MIRHDTRAQSVQIGAILVFAIAVLAFTSWQTFIIPEQNADVEFTHNQEVQQQLIDLRTTLNTMGDSTTKPATVNLGTQYPSRFLFVNPSPPTGTIQSAGTTDPAYNLTIQNATPVNPDAQQLWAELGPTDTTTASFNTGAITYTPNYNEYQSAPQTVYENSLLHNTFGQNSSLAVTDQSLITDNRITVTTLNGTLDKTQVDTASLDFQPLSTQTRTLQLTPTNGPLTLTFPTRLALTEWQSLLGDNYTVTRTNNSFTNSQRVYTIQIQSQQTDPDTPYQLQLAKIGIGTDTTQPSPAYLTTLTDTNPAQISLTDVYEFTVETRDAYNGPTANTHINATVSDQDGSLTPNQATTGPNGQLTFQYSPSTTGTAQINLSITDGYSPTPTHNPQSPANITLDVTITPPQTGPGNNSTAGAGGGLESTYDENSPQETFSVPNGRLTQITCTDQFILSDGSPATRPNGDGDIIRFSGSLTNTKNEQYTIDIQLARKIDGSNDWNKKLVRIFDREAQNTVTAVLTRTAAARIYTGSSTDVLNLSNYDNAGTGSGSFSSVVQNIQNLATGSEVTWQTSQITGRLTAAFKCDPSATPPSSGISVLGGSTPNTESTALKFTTQVASGTTRTITGINITTPGRQNDKVDDIKQLKRKGQSSEIRLTAIPTNGVNKSGSLRRNVKLDGTNYSLDTNAVFSNGARIRADLGEFNNGNAGLTYKIASSAANADVVVTFLLRNNAPFRVPLRVTNVNT